MRNSSLFIAMNKNFLNLTRQRDGGQAQWNSEFPMCKNPHLFKLLFSEK